VRRDGREIEVVEVTLEDLEIANRLASEALGRSLDELPPQSRGLLLELARLFTEEAARLSIDRRELRVTRRWIRERTSWGDTQLKIHLARLVDLEYLAAHTAGHAQRHLYELLYEGDGRDEQPHLPGLIDVDELRAKVDGCRESGPETADSAATVTNRSAQKANRSGQNGNRSAPGRPPVGGWSGGGRTGEISSNPFFDRDLPASEGEGPEKTQYGPSSRVKGWMECQRLEEAPAGCNGDRADGAEEGTDEEADVVSRRARGGPR
jgi:hypothetical protein